MSTDRIYHAALSQLTTLVAPCIYMYFMKLYRMASKTAKGSEKEALVAFMKQCCALHNNPSAAIEYLRIGESSIDMNIKHMYGSLSDSNNTIDNWIGLLYNLLTGQNDQAPKSNESHRFLTNCICECARVFYMNASLFTKTGDLCHKRQNIRHIIQNRIENMIGFLVPINVLRDQANKICAERTLSHQLLQKIVEQNESMVRLHRDISNDLKNLHNINNKLLAHITSILKRQTVSTGGGNNENKSKKDELHEPVHVNHMIHIKRGNNTANRRKRNDMLNEESSSTSHPSFEDVIKSHQRRSAEMNNKLAHEHTESTGKQSPFIDNSQAPIKRKLHLKDAVTLMSDVNDTEYCVKLPT